MSVISSIFTIFIVQRHFVSSNFKNGASIFIQFIARTSRGLERRESVCRNREREMVWRNRTYI